MSGGGVYGVYFAVMNVPKLITVRRTVTVNKRIRARRNSSGSQIAENLQRRNPRLSKFFGP